LAVVELTTRGPEVDNGRAKPMTYTEEQAILDTADSYIDRIEDLLVELPGSTDILNLTEELRGLLRKLETKRKKPPQP
jgi:hypothetical protein